MTLLGWEFEQGNLDGLPDGFADYLLRYSDALREFASIAENVGALRADGRFVDPAEISTKLLWAMENYVVVDDAAGFADSAAAA